MYWSIRISLRRSQYQGRPWSKPTCLAPHWYHLANTHCRLKDLEGDWHEFESKALRKENERKNQEARRAVRMEEHEREKAKRRASGSATAEREPKRARPSSSHGEMVKGTNCA